MGCGRHVNHIGGNVSLRKGVRLIFSHLAGGHVWFCFTSGGDTSDVLPVKVLRILSKPLFKFKSSMVHLKPWEQDCGYCYSSEYSIRFAQGHRGVKKIWDGL